MHVKHVAPLGIISTPHILVKLKTLGYSCEFFHALKEILIILNSKMIARFLDVLPWSLRSFLVLCLSPYFILWTGAVQPQLPR